MFQVAASSTMIMRERRAADRIADEQYDSLSSSLYIMNTRTEEKFITYESLGELFPVKEAFLDHTPKRGSHGKEKPRPAVVDRLIRKLGISRDIFRRL
jgi:hypothetical protein